MYLPEMEQKIEKKFSVFQIIAFELTVGYSRNLEQDTWYGQSMCEQTPLRFHVTLGETFSKSTSLRMMKKHDKSTLMEISQVFVTLSHVDCQSVFGNGAF